MFDSTKQVIIQSLFCLLLFIIFLDIFWKEENSYLPALTSFGTLTK